MALPPRLTLSLEDLLGSSFIIPFLSVSLMFDQLEISSMVRKHPVHMFACGWTMQIFTHGESTSFRFQISSLIVDLIIPFYHWIFYLTLPGGYRMLRHDQLLRCGVFYLYPPLVVLSLQLQLITFRPRMLLENLLI